MKNNKIINDGPRELFPYAQRSNMHPTTAKLVFDALGDDIDNIKVSTFASLVDLYEQLNERQQPNTAQLMHEKSRLSREHTNEK